MAKTAQPAPPKPGFKERFKQRLTSHHALRWHMSLILLAVTASGVLSSKLMLMAGLRSVGVRYPLAVLVAYCAFLGFIRFWIWMMVPGRPRKPGHWWKWGSHHSASDTSSSTSYIGGGSGSSGPDGGIGDAAFRFGGGTSGGGGASSDWDETATQAASLPFTSHSGGSGIGSGGSGGGGGDGDLGDAIWVILALALVLVVVCGAGIYLIYIAPEFLPEAALQALFASGLAKATHKAAQGDWLGSIVSKTAIPFVAVLAVVSGMGYVVHTQCPSAVKLSQALTCKAR